MISKLNELERALSGIPPHPSPRADLEQYATPADIAASLLFEARALGDIEEKDVLDLGCGTGVLGLGAALLGAARVRGIDVDEAAVAVARREAERLRVPAEFTVGDVASFAGRADTVVMNPPFGAQSRGADRPFLDAAFRSAGVVYSMHNASTRAFVEAYAADAGATVTHRWRLAFELRHQFRHQTRASKVVDVLAFRFERGAAHAVDSGT